MLQSVTDALLHDGIDFGTLLRREIFPDDISPKWERQARVILGDSERQVAEKFAEAAKSYEHNPVALHLRAMNMLYEGLKKNSTIVIVPSTAVESMQLGGLAGLTALTMGIDKVNQVGATLAESLSQASPDALSPRLSTNGAAREI